MDADAGEDVEHALFSSLDTAIVLTGDSEEVEKDVVVNGVDRELVVANEVVSQLELVPLTAAVLAVDFMLVLVATIDVEIVALEYDTEEWEGSLGMCKLAP